MRLPKNSPIEILTLVLWHIGVGPLGNMESAREDGSGME